MVWWEITPERGTIPKVPKTAFSEELECQFSKPDLHTLEVRLILTSTWNPKALQ